ncbi:putative aquaporin NIP4-1 [Euphorbia lathyris]|uniref:putative aquaporin NIP4-1 n=1 Tax=Euphorbia lathyris TaxID=212925 RepID=UPI003313F8F8
MAQVSPSSPNKEFPNKATLCNNDLSTIEEGKITPSEAASPFITTSPINAHKIIAELVGTYIIIFIGCGSILIERIHPFTMMGIGEPVAWGLAVMVMIYSFGHVSGAHFNPAITIAFAVTYKFPWPQVIGYVGSQLAGSTLAVLTLKVMFHSKTLDISVTTTQFVGEATTLEAFIWEFILSFILMLTICGVATDNRAVTELSGVVVGATMIFNMIIAGNITGASMNPARSLGPAFVSRKLCYVWLYITAPILGMVVASAIYSVLWLPKSPNLDKEEDSSKNV